MDLSHIPVDAEGIKKFKQEMHGRYRYFLPIFAIYYTASKKTG